jgi:hypothetical protein
MSCLLEAEVPGCCESGRRREAARRLRLFLGASIGEGSYDRRAKSEGGDGEVGQTTERDHPMRLVATTFFVVCFSHCDSPSEDGGCENCLCGGFVPHSGPVRDALAGPQVRQDRIHSQGPSFRL